MGSDLQIKEHMEVVSLDGEHVGTVDKLQGDQIKLTKSDPSSQGQHHYIPLEWVSEVGDVVHLSLERSEIFETWPAAP